jgi:hypothetical protein
MLLLCRAIDDSVVSGGYSCSKHCISDLTDTFRTEIRCFEMVMRHGPWELQISDKELQISDKVCRK